MDSSENFLYEVPIIAEEVLSYDNDCTIIEPGKSPERETNSYSKHNENVPVSVTKAKSNGFSCNKNNQQLIDLDESSAIVIDEDSEKDNDCTIIENVEINHNNNISKKSDTIVKSSHRSNVICYDDILKKNRLLMELIEKCLDMENSEGMLRIVNRTLIPIYIDAEESFKKSESFQKALTLVFKKLETEPEKKFSHIKNLCETLKLYKTRKRVSLVTLRTNLKDIASIKSHINPTKRKKIDIIDLDKDDDVEIVCNSDTDVEVNDVINDESPLPINKLNKPKTGDSGSHNSSHTNENEKNDDDDIILVDDEYDKENKTTSMNDDTPQIDLSMDDDEKLNCKKIMKPGDLLKPSHEVSITEVSTKIAIIEEKIAEYSKIIKSLEEQEVTIDNYDSQYIKCELYKSKVVNLYTQLCKLTGTESVKQVKVRLKVASGHPPGPARCLEEFINDNVDPTGNPLFPDMHDVIKCVEKANVIDKMGWSSREIETEARALFIQYGRTIQKRRQKREWCDLMTYVKVEAPDPADEDPTLQARLQENTKIAKKNENDLLNRFAQMENSMCESNPDLMLTIENEFESDDSDFETAAIPGVSNSNEATTASSDTNCDSEHSLRLNSYIESCSGNITNNIVMYNPWNNADGKITPENTITALNDTEVRRSVDPVETIVKELFDDARSNKTNDQLEDNMNAVVSKATVKLDIIPNLEIDSNEAATCAIDTQIHSFKVDSNTEVASSTVMDAVTTNVEACQTNFAINIKTTNDIEDYETNISNTAEAGINVIPIEDTSHEAFVSSTSELENVEPSQNDIKSEVIVKREPLDIPSMLEQLGTDFSVTILDIEDPFLVIEISDSSDSENEAMS